MKLITLSVLVLAAVSGAASQLQTTPPEAQRIRLQFKDSATYKEARDVDIKSAVLTRRLSDGSRSRFASVRVLLSNLADDLCAKVDAFEALSVAPLPLPTDADFILTLASFAEEEFKKDIAESDLHKMFFAPEAPERTFFVAIEGSSPEQLFPNQHVSMTNPKRLGNNQFRSEDALDAQGVYFTDEEGDRYVCGDMSCWRGRSALWPVTRLVLIGSALLTMASSIVFALVWIPRKLLGRLQGVEHFSVRVVPLLAVMTLAATVWLGFATPPLALTRVNAMTIALCLGSMAFAILSVASLVVASRSIGFEMNRGTRIHSMLVALSCCGLTSYLAYWGGIGVRTWRW